MSNRILVGYRRWMIPVPGFVWQRLVVRSVNKDSAKQLAGLSDDHHRVRDFVVREMHRVDAPLSPELIGERLGLPVDRVAAILDELEKGMVFLYRSQPDRVTWAYPVTVDSTPHQVTYSSGEQGHAA
jgi:hypothetical protein